MSVDIITNVNLKFDTKLILPFYHSVLIFWLRKNLFYPSFICIYVFPGNIFKDTHFMHDYRLILTFLLILDFEISFVYEHLN